MKDQYINSNSALAIYRNYFVQLVILETLVMYDEVKIEDMLAKIIQRMKGNNVTMDSVKIPYLTDRMIYLQKLGLIKVENEGVRIENLGIDTLRNGTLQNMVSGAFFNYRTITIASMAFYVSILAAVVSAFALLK